MLEEKIQILLADKEVYMMQLYPEINKSLELTGMVDASAITYIDMLFTLLALNYLGDAQKLDLYKKLIKMLKTFGIQIGSIASSGLGYITVFAGSGAVGLSSGILNQLQKHYIFKDTPMEINFYPTLEVMYFCYPTAYGYLATIIDTNGFNVTNGWTTRIEKFLVDGSLIDYTIYESKNITTLENYLINFNL